MLRCNNNGPLPYQLGASPHDPRRQAIQRANGPAHVSHSARMYGCTFRFLPTDLLPFAPLHGLVSFQVPESQDLAHRCHMALAVDQHGCTDVRIQTRVGGEKNRPRPRLLGLPQVRTDVRMYGCTVSTPPSGSPPFASLASHFKLLSHRTLPDHCQLHSRWTGTDVRMYASKPPAGGENLSLGHAPPSANTRPMRSQPVSSYCGSRA